MNPLWDALFTAATSDPGDLSSGLDGQYLQKCSEDEASNKHGAVSDSIRPADICGFCC